MACEVRSDLLVDPEARSRHCAEARDVIVCHAVRGWLRQATRDPSNIGMSRMRGGHKPRRCALARLETVAVGAFDGARELHSGRHVDLAKDVAQVSLHRLLAEEQLAGDLGVRLPVDDQPRDL